MSTNGNGNTGEERFFNEVKQSLDARAEIIDEKILLRLRTIRHQAILEAEGRKKGMFFLPRWIQASAFATVATAVVLVVVWFYSQRPAFLFKNPEDFEIVSSQDQMELYEDLDFYQWLAASDSRG